MLKNYYYTETKWVSSMNDSSYIQTSKETNIYNNVFGELKF